MTTLIPTFGGKILDADNIAPQDFDFRNHVPEALSRIDMFNGAGAHFSVAQFDCIIAEKMCREFGVESALGALLRHADWAYLPPHLRAPFGTKKQEWLSRTFEAAKIDMKKVLLFVLAEEDFRARLLKSARAQLLNGECAHGAYGDKADCATPLSMRGGLKSLPAAKAAFAWADFYAKLQHERGVR